MHLLVVLLALLGDPAVDKARAAIPVPAGLSWADADHLVRKLDEMEALWRKGDPPRRTVRITATELNSYLNLTLHPRLPAGLSDLSVQLDADRITARAMVDLEQMAPRDRSATKGLDALALLSGRVPLELKGRFRSDEPGFGAFDLQEVRLGGWPLPISLLADRVAASTRKPERPDGIDIAAPFRLPYGVKRIRLQSGVANLDL